MACWLVEDDDEYDEEVDTVDVNLQCDVVDLVGEKEDTDDTNDKKVPIARHKLIYFKIDDIVLICRFFLAVRALE